MEPAEGSAIGTATVDLADTGGLTWQQWVRNIAAAYGVDDDLRDDDIDYLLWEHTPWPVGGPDEVGPRLVELFRNWKGMPMATEETDDDDGASLVIYDLVDEVPGKAPSRRASKWDPVIDRAMESPGKFVPVDRPKNFGKGSVTWLTERSPGVVVELRADKVYLKWDPESAGTVE